MGNDIMTLIQAFYFLRNGQFLSSEASQVMNQGDCVSFFQACHPAYERIIFFQGVLDEQDIVFT